MSDDLAIGRTLLCSEWSNYFQLTSLEPEFDLTSLPISWQVEVTEGTIDSGTQVIVDADKRGARLAFPPASLGNFGAGRMKFGIGPVNPPHSPLTGASAEVLIRNVVPDAEQKDFRFLIKAHLCHDGQGHSTSRTPTEVLTLMTDVSKVLSQCGIWVTTGQIVTTQVNPAYMDLDSTSWTEMWFLFDTDEDETAIDVFFINTIDFDPANNCGLTTGLTGTPAMSGAAEAGIAIPDTACDASQSNQELVRTIAHEITHYLLNHNPPDADHVPNSHNLMDGGASATKRDLNENQCVELRMNSEGD